MDEQQDYAGLDWVKEESEQTLAEARQALATLPLPGDIQQTLNSGVEHPLALLSLINGLRQLRGEDPLSEATFFFPGTRFLIDPVEHPQLENLEKNGLVPLLRKIRQKYQLTLAGYLRDQNRARQIKILAKLFAKLQDLSWGAPHSLLWEASVALTEGLDNQSIEQNIHVTNLLRALDGQIRLFIKEGAPFINTHPNDELFRGLLYYIATSQSQNGFIGALKARYQLEEALTRAKSGISVALARVEATKPVEEGISEDSLSALRTPDPGLVESAPEPEQATAPIVTEATANAHSAAHAHSTDGQEDSQDTHLFVHSDLRLLLDADAYLSTWRNTLPRKELALFQTELMTLGERASEAGLASLAELCDVLLDVMNYLDKHENSLPGVLAAPLSNGFEAMVDMINMVSAQKTPVPPQSVFTELRESLKTLLTAEPVAASRPEISLAVGLEPVPAEPVVEMAIEEHDQERVAWFLEEAKRLSEEGRHRLEDWLNHRQNLTSLTDLQRSLHTLKDCARMANQPELGDLSHAIEGVYSAIASGKSSADKASVYLLKTAHDQIDQILVALKNQQSPGSVTPLIEQLEQWIFNNDLNIKQLPLATADASVKVLPDYLGQATTAYGTSRDQTAERAVEDRIVEEPALATTRIDTPVTSSAVNTMPKSNGMVSVPGQLLDSLIHLAGEASINRSRIEQKIQGISSTLKKMDSTIDRVKEQLRRLDTQAQMISTFAEEHGCDPELTPLAMDQSSERTQLSRSLVKSATDLKGLREGIQDKNRDAETLLLQQSRTLVELQEKLMQARTVAFSHLLPRLRKVTHQLATELDKPVNLNISNAEDKMDLTLLERLLAPLEHLLRNAIDHGIESAQERLALGKPETGSLTLAIARDGADMVVELNDDGHGINLQAVHAKALEKHLISAEDELTDQQIAQLTLEAGFSTCESVTQISGRGVGLDIVHTEVRQMGGSIQIDSEPGKGTSFKLRLPCTLPVNPALMVQVADNLYALPMQSIDGVTVVAPKVLTDCYQNNTPLPYGGTAHQLIFLGELLGDASPSIQPKQCPIVILQRGGKNLALHVDEIIGSRDILTKSLGPQFAGVTGVNGATLCADGHVAIIIDPATLVCRHRIGRHPH